LGIHNVLPYILFTLAKYAPSPYNRLAFNRFLRDYNKRPISSHIEHVLVDSPMWCKERIARIVMTPQVIHAPGYGTIVNQYTFEPVIYLMFKNMTGEYKAWAWQRLIALRRPAATWLIKILKEEDQYYRRRAWNRLWSMMDTSLWWSVLQQSAGNTLTDAEYNKLWSWMLRATEKSQATRNSLLRHWVFYTSCRKRPDLAQRALRMMDYPGMGPEEQDNILRTWPKKSEAKNHFGLWFLNAGAARHTMQLKHLWLETTGVVKELAGELLKKVGIDPEQVKADDLVWYSIDHPDLV
jgi:hypothetical protein